MKYVKTMSLALVIMLLTMGSVSAETDVVKPKPQATCPIMAGKINKEIYTDYEGKRVYFCCKGCIAVFQKDPAKYIKKLEDEGVSLKDVPNVGHKKESRQDTDKGHDKHSAHGGGCGGGCS